MQPEISKGFSGSSNRWSWIWIRNWILPIAFFALLLGSILAFGDYVRQYTATRSYRRRMNHQFVQMDTRAALVRRFEFGAAGGAVLGFLIAIRNRATRID